MYISNSDRGVSLLHGSLNDDRNKYSPSRSNVLKCRGNKYDRISNMKKFFKNDHPLHGFPIELMALALIDPTEYDAQWERIPPEENLTDWERLEIAIKKEKSIESKCLRDDKPKEILKHQLNFNPNLFDRYFTIVKN